METAKIRLSSEELELMQNSRFILTKNSIIEKVSSAFAELGAKLTDDYNDRFAETYPTIAASGSKVSKGEKYQGMPYVILDYPRIFGRQHLLAIRIMFWWANFYSISLHVKGRYIDSILSNLFASQLYTDPEVLISFSGDEWNHDLNHEDYTLLSAFTVEEITGKIQDGGFIKLSKKVELLQWEVVQEKLLEDFSALAKCVIL